MNMKRKPGQLQDAKKCSHCKSWRVDVYSCTCCKKLQACADCAITYEKQWLCGNCSITYMLSQGKPLSLSVLETFPGTLKEWKYKRKRSYYEVLARQLEDEQVKRAFWIITSASISLGFEIGDQSWRVWAYGAKGNRRYVLTRSHLDYKTWRKTFMISGVGAKIAADTLIDFCREQVHHGC